VSLTPKQRWKTLTREAASWQRARYRDTPADKAFAESGVLIEYTMRTGLTRARRARLHVSAALVHSITLARWIPFRESTHD
jgi:hypothetical protein